MELTDTPTRVQRRQHQRKKPRNLAGGLARAVVGISAGLLFAFGMNMAAESAGRYGTDLKSLIHAKENSVADLKAETQNLEDTAKRLQEATRTVNEVPDDTKKILVGPGISVTLTDAPVPEPFPAGLNADDLVIHQQDIEAVFNALWSGGAEAVAIEGMRVQLNSQVSCVGNVININGQLFSPPYEITAIGESKKMRQALARDEQIEIIQQYVARYNLGFTVKDQREVRMDQISGEIELDYAQVVGDV
ncbi:MAG: DUF881 domain-containing protein [Actinomycetaceae bacterium]|nr:DUF881 domain-containing protein [Actinomycetaceae bacterium]